MACRALPSDGLEVDPRDVGLGGVREHVEAALGGVVDRAAVVEDRVVDGQRGDAGVVERDVLVRVVRVGRGVGDDVGPGRLRAGARGGGDRDVRRVLRVLRLVEALELVDVAAVVGHRDAGALAGVVRGAAADGDEAVALVLLVEAHRVHDVVVLGVGLHLVVDHDLEAVVLQRLGDLVHDVGAAQARRHHQRLLEAELQGLRADDLVRARAHERPRERVELLDREQRKHLFDLHGSPFWCRCGSNPTLGRLRRSGEHVWADGDGPCLIGQGSAVLRAHRKSGVAIGEPAAARLGEAAPGVPATGPVVDGRRRARARRSPPRPPAPAPP